MGAILGLGVTHVPLLAGRDEDMARILRRVLEDPDLPERYRRPEGWPEPMRQEWGADEGLGAARRHREALVAWFRKARRLLDDFGPDVVVIWGDDQYENFKEDIIPPFCVLAYESIEHRPWAESRWRNVWDEPKDAAFAYTGHRPAAKLLTGGLLDEGFDVSYAYRPLHHPLGHAFMNTLLFLDYDRQGFPYPVVPFQVNCYGRRVIAQRGGLGGVASMRAEDLDPPSPSPARCFDLGGASARVLSASPWRVALIASSSWSHAFLTPKHHLLYPDVEADRAMYETLRAGNYQAWRQTSLAAVEESGQQEMLNWMCLVGAMAELDRRPAETDLIETYLFNSSKCFAFFPPR
ncbi:MAG: extradiol ring-cleavage dioxygenase [Candidatus Rokuibacteriota bacterium]|nr:MAG: extradiol ring-cleavage dioxygenase [Candidatus Rokubacteria bacterium]